MKNNLAILAMLCAIAAPASGQQYTVKFATLAPEGSTWMNVMREYDAAIRKESGGRLGFRIYPGGQQGDEKGMLRKIRIGQLQSAGFTGVGMGEIATKTRILDTPFLARTDAEVDHMYDVFGKELESALGDGGFVLLGWADLGFVYVFTNSPVKKPEDLQGIKMWTWEGDPIAETAFGELHMHPIPLSIENVMTSLQTGLIDAFYTTPYAAIELQWFTRVKYMVDVPLADASGSVLISKKFFDGMPADLQEILVRNGKKFMAELVAANRKDNASSIDEFKKRGITILKVDESELNQFVDVGETTRMKLVGKLFPRDFVQRVEKELADFRKTEKGSR